LREGEEAYFLQPSEGLFFLQPSPARGEGVFFLQPESRVAEDTVTRVRHESSL
jgi:hypothetical protein